MVVNVPDPNDTPEAVAGDCKTKSCDASGNVVEVEDLNDAPPTDGNPCTTEGCNGTTPINYEPVADGMLCGPDASCGVAGSGYEQTTAKACQGGVCVDAESASCGLYQCNGTVCHQGCTGDGQCVPGTYCSGGQCVPQIGLGNLCSTPANCASGFCVDGVCCNAACNGTCQTCELPGQVGVCSNVAYNTDPDNECAGNQVCNGAGVCKKPTADPCVSNNECVTGQCEDGVCCNQDCPGDCAVCNQSGAVGTCTSVPMGQTGTCMANSACNSAGQCKLLNGQVCGQIPSNCLSGLCPIESGLDVCCDTACNGTCQSCQAAKTGGTDGVCGNILDGIDPENECSGGACNMTSGDYCCNGDGTCQIPP
jgi:hypothetical protein